MIKALWFALRIGALIAAAVWVADQPGGVRVEWQDYTFTFQLGFFVLLIVVVVVLAIFIYRVIRALVDFPRKLGRYNEQRWKEKGYEALTIGLTAVAAGDTKAALAQAKKTKKFLPHDTGLPLLLQAQAARMDGREEDAAKCFAVLLEDKNASFLGVRGLLQRALEGEDLAAALSMAQKALGLHPKQPWILKIVYDLHIRLGHWPAALEALTRLEKIAALERQQILSDRCALYLAQAENDKRGGFFNNARDNAERALRIDSGFAPAALRLSGLYAREGHAHKARQILERAWKISPHPALMEAWDHLIDAQKVGDALYRVRWLEKLLQKNTASAQGCLKIARAALQAGLWGETRAFLEKAQALEESAELYKLYAEMEAHTSGNADIIRENLQRANNAPPDKVWFCKETGRVYHRWSPVAAPHGAFNTIIWGVPVLGARQVVTDKKTDMAEALIEAPTAVL